MLFINRLLLVGLLSVGITAATTAQAGNQLFTAEWFTFSFGNELTGGDDPSDSYTGFGIPIGLQCNAVQPRCDFQSTPVIITPLGDDAFAPLGGTLDGLNPRCIPWYNWQGMGTNVRPAKGATAVDAKNRPIPPLYRNQFFFTAPTPSAQPNTTFCSATSTDGAGGKGLVQVGHPVTGTWGAYTAAKAGAFDFASAPPVHAAGVRTTGLVGDFPALYPYVYSYTYATLRNDYGIFGTGSGPGDFNIKYYQGNLTVASIKVTEGTNKFGGFGGTMRMLGAYTTKVCYYRAGGCSLGRNNWRYDAVGASAMTSGGVVTEGYIATYRAYYYHTELMQKSTVNVYGARFPWTTGTVTLTAVGRGPHKTVHTTTGYDNRTTASGKGTIQLVTPILTRWLQPCCKFETGGVGILRIKFIPEPQTWAMLVAGISLLGVGYRMRGR